MSPYTTNLEHLHAELYRLDLLIEQAVQQFRASRQQHTPTEFQGLYISDDEIDRSISAPTEPLQQTEIEFQTKAIDLQATIQQRVAETQSTEVTLRLPYLQQIFDLSPFETDLLLLAIAPEINLRYQRLYAYLQDDVTRKRPSVELALRLFCYSPAERVRARTVFSPDSTLLALHLLLLHEDPIDRPSPLLSRTLKLDDRIAEFLLGSDRPDSALLQPIPLVQIVEPQQQLPDLELPEPIARSLQQIGTLETHRTAWFCLLYGTEGTGKQACAEAIASIRGRSLLVLDLATILQTDLPCQTAIDLAFREAQLYRSVIYLKGWHQLLADEQKAQSASSTTSRSAIGVIDRAISQFPGLVLAGSETAWQPSTNTNYRFIQLELPLPDARRRETLWHKYLQQCQQVSSDIQLDYLASAFRFSGGQIQQAIECAQTQAQLDRGLNYKLTLADLLIGCRMTSNQHLVSLARKITPKRSWQDLVLPQDAIAQLQELCQQVRHRTQVYTDWGFDRHLSLGKGVIALFTGESGTGKTLSAEILAKELGLELYQIDLSLVVSKYIGETEKNLSRVFTEAQASNAILLFDEADALFGKRSDIKDAHDRYANIETNYLLQRVEAYEGVIILTTNLSKNIDAAFTRRLHFSIEFPFPDEYHRLKIWQRMFPAQAPVSTDVDFDFLADRFKIAGGNIKNVVTAAAFRAAGADGSIEMEHIILSLKREYHKLGKVCERTEFDPYYDLIV
jgi:ATP-dependent 26S proteasome regulatory subunit